ncbi:hypothetical protein D3C74_313490 [compost metagenome]
MRPKNPSDCFLPAGAGGYIPTSRTYPPSGIALTPYSVSPLVRDHSVGPNPTK